MALEQDTGEDRPSAAMRGGLAPPDETSPEVTTGYRPDHSPIPSIVASLTPDVPDIPGGTYGDTPVAGDVSVADAGGMTLPFIPPGMSKDQIDKLRDTNVRILDEEIGAKKAAQLDLDRRDREFEARMESANRAIGHEGSHLQPWNADREMASRKHNLWEEFGSPGFLVAMMGSAFTAMPMVSALNAGAAAMNAINQGDLDGYDKAFEAWQQNTKLAIDRMKMEQEQFNNLDHLRTDNMVRWKEELGLKLAQFGDSRKKALLDAGFDEDVSKAIDAQQKLIGQLESNFQAHAENKALFDGIQDELKKNPNQSWFNAYATIVKKLTEAKHPGAISSEERARHDRALEDIASRKITVEEARQQETARHNTALETINQDKLTTQTEKDRARQEEIDRHNRFMEDIAEKRTAETSRHNQRVEDVQSGKLSVEEARQQETSEHNRRMEDIGAGRILAGEDRDKAKQEETNRHNERMEALANARIEKTGAKAAQDAADRRDVTADVIAAHADDPNWTPGKTVEEVKRRLAEATRVPGKAAMEKQDKDVIEGQLRKDHPDWTDAQVIEERNKKYAESVKAASQTPEGIALSKFIEQNPGVSAEKMQAFRQLGRAMGRSPSTMAVSKFVSEHPEATAEDIMRFGQIFNRAQSFARTLGTRAANIDVGLNEVKKFATAAIAASDKVERTDWATLNRYYQGALRELSDPAMQIFDNANTSLATAYAQTMSRGNTNTVAAMERADKILQTATGSEAYKKGVEFLIFEASLVASAVGETFDANAPGGGTIKSIKKIGD